ncbi:ketopantoate reductase PanE/ApbA C terminal-domain-containing protein [Syncephalastrum racemosum]|uniref:2-dehydropantoate 2-reductase n=1 Tax=Syncephalastrum racemosum TaxID=13706 RepID=A0A1X2HNQ2_SYNRA|nr:ketopantoate reductase PanE/ApbA C terminal-domain-containing protein [Syncephalastrum racemosum]
MRFHILGTGAIGCQIAVALRERFPVTLLPRSRQQVEEFRATYQNKITYQRLGSPDSVKVNVDAEPMDAEGPIENLIISTKVLHTADALRKVQPRLSDKSTLIFLQNGMGAIDEVLDKLWTDTKPPSIISGVIRHAVERVAPFSIIHNSGWEDKDGLYMGAMPHSQPDVVKPVLDAFASFPELNTTILPWTGLLQRMERKLVVNATINPIAAVLECRNAIILESEMGRRLLRSLCDEAYSVLDNLEMTRDELYDHVLEINKIAGYNVCSTLQDLRAKRPTEIDYINGYLLRLAKERNIELPTHRAIVDLIKVKETAFNSSFRLPPV